MNIINESVNRICFYYRREKPYH